MRLKPIVAVSAALFVFGAGIFAYLLQPPDDASFAGDIGDGAGGDPGRGVYVARMAGCIACHTDTGGNGALMAGGAPIETPFGTFRAPNITQDRKHGIGSWSFADFASAVTLGKSPKGELYFPVFPYVSYAKLTKRDLADLWAAMKTVPAVAKPSAGHDISFPFDRRILLRAWQNLFFEPKPFETDSARSPAWNRGAYIVNGPGHCGACHTPRNPLGGLMANRHLQGSSSGPGGERVPAITGSAIRSMGWTKTDIAWSLRTGLTPKGDSFSGSMGEVVRHGLAWLTGQDRDAIATYLMATE
jgi:mono/diheme cytochrome c family protein